MDFLTLAKERYSVRSFKNDKVPDDVIAKIVEAGYVAPTACNNQPVKIYVVKSEEGLEKMKKCTNCHFNAPVVFMICADVNRAWTRPFDGHKSDDVDASIVTTHMMMEAWEQGIGSTWVMFFDPAAAKAEFEIPEGIEPVALLPMGYASEKAVPSPRHAEYRPIEEMVEYV